MIGNVLWYYVLIGVCYATVYCRVRTPDDVIRNIMGINSIMSYTLTSIMGKWTPYITCLYVVLLYPYVTGIELKSVYATYQDRKEFVAVSTEESVFSTDDLVDLMNEKPEEAPQEAAV
jgi:hypothetical protein